MMIKTAYIAFMATLASAALALAPPLPRGDQFQANTYLENTQWRPAVAANADGSFVMVWESAKSDTDADTTSIRGQFFAADGSAIGEEFQANTYTTGKQDDPAVEMTLDGGFVVVWQSGGQFGAPGSDGNNAGIGGRRYGSDGLAIGGEFQINSYTPNRQTRPAMAPHPDGGFVVVWESEGSIGNDSSQSSIQGQLHAADGSTIGSQFQVNTYTTVDQRMPVVAADAKGNFVVLWESQWSNGPDAYDSIQGQRYASDGTRIGGEFQVNSYTGNSGQLRPSVAVSPDGHILAVWHSDASDEAEDKAKDKDSYGILGQLYAANGTRIGGEFQVNSITAGGQTSPSAAAASAGFLVVWESIWTIEGQLFALDGSSIGDEFQVNSFAASIHMSPSVTTDSGSHAVVGWSSDGSPGSDQSWFSIQGQRLEIPVFVDGFESGNTAVWSVTRGE
ncbi:MAG: hypothetical protein GY856_54450 [bacterium]|nr:hypothetical protein [bacterium]